MVLPFFLEPTSRKRKKFGEVGQKRGLSLLTHFRAMMAHYGSPGMQERAKLAGGRLVVRSRVSSGREAEIIPHEIRFGRLFAPTGHLSGRVVIDG